MRRRRDADDPIGWTKELLQCNEIEQKANFSKNIILDLQCAYTHGKMLCRAKTEESISTHKSVHRAKWLAEYMRNVPHFKLSAT